MMRLVVVVIVLALAGVLTPVGHSVTDHATTQRKSSSQSHGHDPVKQEPKKDELPRKTGEKKEALRHVPQRRAVRQRTAESWIRVAPPRPSTESAVLDDVSRVEHLLVLTRPAVLQVFRN